MTQSSIFKWSYISNKVCGRQVRKAIKARACTGLSPLTVINIHNRHVSSYRHVSSWCSTTLDPPQRKYDTAINFGYNNWQIANPS